MGTEEILLSAAYLTTPPRSKKGAADKSQEAAWFAHFKAYEKSGNTQAQYCELHGLKSSHFSHWRTRYLLQQKMKERAKISAEKLRFIPVVSSCSQPAAPINLPTPKDYVIATFPNGIKLELPLSMPVSDMQALMGGYHAR